MPDHAGMEVVFRAELRRPWEIRLSGMDALEQSRRRPPDQRKMAGQGTADWLQKEGAEKESPGRK